MVLITKSVATSYILPTIHPAHRSAIVLTCRDIGNDLVPGMSLNNIHTEMCTMSAQMGCHNSCVK